jgi:hypothetical protein
MTASPRSTLPPVLPAAQYVPLNGAELAAILLRRATLALDGHWNFAEGIKFRDAEFRLTLDLDVPNGPPMHVDLVTHTVSNRNGLEIRQRCVAMLDTALKSGTCFSEGLSYPLFNARLYLHIDAAGGVPTTAMLYQLEVGDDTQPDRVRLANALPTTLDLLPTEEEAAEVLDDDRTLGLAPPKWQVGDRVKHPGYNNGKAVIIEVVEPDGLRVKTPDSGKSSRIGYDGNVYKGLQLVERPGQAKE